MDHHVLLQRAMWRLAGRADAANYRQLIGSVALVDGPSTTAQAVYAYNPSILDRTNVLVRVSSFSWCTLNASDSPWEVKRIQRQRQETRRFSLTFWLRRGSIHGVIPASEDARAFRLHGRVHAVFKRASGPSLKRMWLAELEPSVREVPLSFIGARAVEGNWAPFVWNGTLHLSYLLCPHVVLQCDDRSGACHMVYNTTPAEGCPAYQGRVYGAKRRPMALHGGSPTVPVDGPDGQPLLLGAAHLRLYEPQ